MGLVAGVPKDQRIVYKVTPLPGQLMTADSVGGQLVALAKLYKASAKEIDGAKWTVLVNGIRTNDDGSIEFELLIAPFVAKAKGEQT